MTIDFELSAEQRELQEMARRFAKEEIAPKSAECDKKHIWPEDIYRKGWELGLLNMNIPADYGGTGLGELEQCIIIEELAYGDGGMAITFGVNCLATQPIIIAGTPEQKERILKPFCETFNIGAFGLTEPGGGSDVAALKTTAKKDGDNYILDGEKCFITSAPHASLFTIFATVDKTKGHKGITAFVVPRNTPGVTVGKDEDKMGQRASSTGSIILEGVKVPAANRLGQEGEGMRIAMATLDSTRTPVGALATGIAQCALDHAARYSLQRTSFGKPIGEHQAIAMKLANMVQMVDAARLLTWRAAWLRDKGKTSTLESSITKCFASDIAMDVCNEAIQIFGGYGYMTEYPVEKLLRDAKLCQIYEGANEIQRVVIARELLKRYA